MRIARSFSNLLLRSIAILSPLDNDIDIAGELSGTPLESPEKSLAKRRVLRSLKESVFMRQGDYWRICYQGEVAILKATRVCLLYLLRHPVRDVHVSELVAKPPNLPESALVAGLREASGDPVTARLHDTGPILDSQAKRENTSAALTSCGKDMKEAERFNDFYRVAKARAEMDAIAKQFSPSQCDFSLHSGGKVTPKPR